MPTRQKHLAPVQRRTLLGEEDEGRFLEWYKRYADKTGNDPNPDDPRHYYDYRGFFNDTQGREPLTEGMHLPDTYKFPGHPTYYVRPGETESQYPEERPTQVSNPSLFNRMLDKILTSGQNYRGPAFPRFTGPTADSLMPGGGILSDTPGAPSWGMVINRRNLPRMLEQWQSNARNRPMLNLLGDMANPENVAAQSWLETVAPRFAKQRRIFEIPEQIPQAYTTNEQVDLVSKGGLPSYFERVQGVTDPGQKAIIRAISEDIGDESLGLMSNKNNELIQSLGALANAQMWERINRASVKAGKISPRPFEKTRNIQDAARNKFMKFLDLLVEEKGPSEASEILTNIGRRE